MSNRLPILAAQIAAAHLGALDAAKTAAERAIEAGHALIEAKSLVKHGEWLPWLREHCRISERSAQFYMKIAKLGLKSETVAFMGIKAASEAVMLSYPDPFATRTPADQREWLLYMLMGIRDGLPPAAAEGHCHWLGRNGWKTPTEWLSNTGTRYRDFHHMREPTDDHRAAWRAFLAEHEAKSLEDLDAELRAIAGAQGHIDVEITGGAQ